MIQTNSNRHINQAARVLVVDDEAVITLALRETLVREGYAVETETNPLQALQRIRETPFALILTDQRMPELSGLEFLAQAKQIQPHTTRILMTGVVNLDTVIEAINQGEIYRFIVKPWLREELIVAVKNAVQRYELVQENHELQQATMAMNHQLARLNQSLEERIVREAKQNLQLADFNNTLEQNLRQSVELCLRTIETFNPALGGQARRVHELCCLIADDLALSREQREILEFSAWLHDIGLMSAPRRLIRLWQSSPNELTETQMKQIEQHPAKGRELVCFLHHLSEVGTIIQAHHERYDGTGFPNQLSGNEIPWLARLLAVICAFVESQLEEVEAAGKIESQSGIAFDPEAVRVFLRNLRRAPHHRIEREVLMRELSEGMVVANEIYTSNGLLLVPEGQTLNGSLLDKLRNHDRVSPIRQRLRVYC